MRDGQLRRTKPEAVPPLREEMKFRRNLRILESLKINKSVLDVGRVVILGLKQERRRSLRFGQKSRIRIAARAAQPARQNVHLEVRTDVVCKSMYIIPLKIQI